MATEPRLLAAGEGELHEQIMRLTQEKRDLQDYAERVTRELRRYQQARPPPQARGDDNLPLPPWATNMQMMSPLLFAYEERINELEAVVERSVGLAEQAQVLTKENDALRVELHSRTEQLRNMQLMAPVRELAARGGGGPGADGAVDDEAQELYRLSVEQNEALAQQNQLLKLQVEKMQQGLAIAQRQATEVQASAVESTQALAAQSERGLKALRTEKDAVERELASERERAETYVRQRTVVEKQLNKVTGELCQETRSREMLQNQVESLQQELQAERQSTEFTKKTWEDQGVMNRDEVERLQADIARTTQAERELRTQNAELERNVSDVSDQLAATRRNESATKQEADQMIWQIESMHRRLRDISDKQQRQQAEISEKDGRIDTLLSEKDSWSSAEHSLKRQVDRLEKRLQDEAQSHQVRRDTEAENLLASLRRTISDLEEQVKKKDHDLREAQTQISVAERKVAWESSACEHASSLHSAETSRIRSDLEEVQQEKQRLDRAVDGARQENSRLRTELDAANSDVRERSAKANADIALHQSRKQDLERALLQATEEAQSSESKFKSASADLARLQAEVREEHTKAEVAAERLRERFSGELRSAERQKQALQTHAESEKRRVAELMKQTETVKNGLRDELTYQRDAYEEKVNRLGKDNRVLKEKNRKMLSALQLSKGAAASIPGAENLFGDLFSGGLGGGRLGLASGEESPPR